MEVSKITNSYKSAIIIGVGDAGSNILNYIYKHSCYKDDIDFFALNTDMQGLSALEIPLSNKLLIGEDITHRAGAGADPEKGRLSATGSSIWIENKLKSGHYPVAFIIAGMGGGTGTGAAPIIAKLCKNLGIYTIAICSTPFYFEGILRQKQATEGINKLKQNVDNIAIFSNDNIVNSNSSITLSDAFIASNKIFYIPIDVILSVVLRESCYVDLYFGDVITTLKGSKILKAASGIGIGEKRVTKAFENIKESPFLKNLKLEESKRLLIDISFSDTGALMSDEFSELHQFFAPLPSNLDFIWGAKLDTTLKANELKICLITGIEDTEEVIKYNNPNKVSIEK